MHIDGKTIFIAGGTGLAGSGAMRALLAASPTVRLRVSHRSQAGAFVHDPRVEYVQGDLTDPAQCRRMVAGCDGAVMAAAFTAGARSSQDEPWRQVTDNVVMDARMLEAFHVEGVRRVIYVSTASAYQDFDGFIREDQMAWDRDPPAAYAGVGWAKRYGEKACKFWHDSTGMEVLIARLANVFGPYAKFDPQQSHFIAATIRKAVDGLDPFTVWGSPHVIRDVLYADDFGRAVVAMLNATDIAFDVFNIGSNRKTSVSEVVEWSLRHAGHQPARISFGEPGPATIAFRALNCAKARDVLGWQPSVTIEDGIKLTIHWWQANKGTWTR
ncbi:MAG: NAD(P)-dependent oxidoreductase [Rhodospirillaceae bacterium]|nr:NAD(P)-dependent oxidoreductase [Rhodospirillales bacterium]